MYGAVPKVVTLSLPLQRVCAYCIRHEREMRIIRRKINTPNLYAPYFSTSIHRSSWHLQQCSRPKFIRKRLYSYSSARKYATGKSYAHDFKKHAVMPAAEFGPIGQYVTGFETGDRDAVYK